jgi:hypothetical protein
VVDAGNSLAPGRIADKELEKHLLMADLVAAGFATMGIDAVALGANDWKLGKETVLEAVKKHELPVLAANLVCNGEQPFPGFKRIERGGMVVGVVGITDGDVVGCEVGDPIEGLKSAVDSLGEVDLTLALIPLRRELVPKFAEKGLEVDLVVDARGGRVTVVPDPTGDTWVFNNGSQGKYLGIADLELVAPTRPWASPNYDENLRNEQTRLETRITAAQNSVHREDDRQKKHLERQIAAYKRDLAKVNEKIEKLKSDDQPRNRIIQRHVSLGADIADHPETLKMVEQTKDAIQDLERTGGFFIKRRRAPVDSPFIGSESCISCHRDQHVQWASTSHSHAYQTLIKKNEGKNLECLPCHVTAFGKDGGPSDANDLLGLHDVQCESCHGPGRAHVADAEAAPLVKVPEEAACVVCHDGQKEREGFDLATYLPIVSHSNPEVEEPGEPEGAP